MHSIRLPFAALLLTYVAAGNVCSQAAEPVDFNRDIRPLLTEHCFKCHGFDSGARKANLRLDDRAAALRPAESGELPLVPGKPEASEVWLRVISNDETERMPPPEVGKKLEAAELDLLRRWIVEGATYARHWSFEKPVRHTTPATKQPDWCRNEIDHFVQSRLEREGLAPSPEADRRTLARRLALDLTGLPPAEADLQQFLSDETPQAYERYVDRLLDSPAYGERWARHWLDLARYADTKGYEKDLRRTIWRFRDWVIDAFNADMPYDQFTREQLAGDLLPQPTPSQLIATAFHRNTMVNDEGGTDDEEFRIAAVKDRVDTTLQVWMGLTMGCAKCHSHKYDPIEQREYYSFYAFFNQTEDADRGDDSPVIETPTHEEAERLEQLRGAIAAAKVRLNTPVPEWQQAQTAWEEQVRKQAAWSTARPKTMQAANGSALELKEDGVVLVKGAGPAKETYTLTFPAGVPSLTALRLEAIPDPSLPKGGSGRAQNDGNFVLTGLKLVVRVAGMSDAEVGFAKAVADFSQQDYPVEHVLQNSDPKKHGWAIAPKLTEPHVAVFLLPELRTLPEGAELTLTLDHQFEYQYSGFSLGKFRISLTGDASPTPVPSVPEAIAAIVRLPVAERKPEQQNALYEYFVSIAPEAKALRDELKQAQDRLNAVRPTTTPVLRELAEAKRRATRMHNRGNFLDPGDAVEPGVPTSLNAWPTGAPLNRLGTAQWLCNSDNPLTARVAVNRVWAHLWGTGLVETQEDFGMQGTLPTHPELLDWLAVEFMERGWSFKKLLKTIVTSATYRQSSRATTALIERDRFNRLLARGPRFRLEAEMIRDQALAVSGLLDRKLYGPSVMPYQPEGMWKSTYSAERWQTSPGGDRYRRGLYTFIKRTTPYPSMLAFDGTSRETCTVRRSRTNTPLQALVTLNDPVYVECAQALARKMAVAEGNSPDAQIAAGFRAALQRDPRPAELDSLARLYRARLEAYQADLAAAEKLATQPLGPLPAGSDVARIAALTAVANVILNLDEFLTKG